MSRKRTWIVNYPNAEKVCRLFAEQKNGTGVASLAHELGVDPNIVYRWIKTDGPGAKGGLIPPSYNIAILEAADRRGIPREQLKGWLQDTCCPTCGQEIPQVGQ